MGGWVDGSVIGRVARYKAEEKEGGGMTKVERGKTKNIKYFGFSVFADSCHTYRFVLFFYFITPLSGNFASLITGKRPEAPMFSIPCRGDNIHHKEYEYVNICKTEILFYSLSIISGQK